MGYVTVLSRGRIQPYSARIVTGGKRMKKIYKVVAHYMVDTDDDLVGKILLKKEIPDKMDIGGLEYTLLYKRVTE